VSAGRAFLPEALANGARAWGFSLNLYSLRSERNWGIGDLSDLRGFVRIAASLGASYVGINPLHALALLEPRAASPYSPTSRFFLNPLYIDIEAVPEFARVAGRRSSRERTERRDALAALRVAPFIDYPRVSLQKQTALRELYRAFRKCDAPRRADFEAFVEREGPRLERFAQFEALDEFLTGTATRHGWFAWPDEYHDPNGFAVARFVQTEGERIDFYRYVQFVADEQLSGAASEGETLGVRLYCDLAVGVDAGGADVWSERGAYVLDETIGAPPDALGPEGQNWGLPPPDPQAFAEHEGERFAELLRANMRHAGALRLDHVMSLRRLFRIAAGQSASEGHYVEYPQETLLAAVERESERARCLVVGEDLGNVPDGFRERMEAAQVLSYRLLPFEREFDGRFKPPASYPRLAVASAGTHDLPTLAGWSLGRDIEARRAADLLPEATALDAQAGRRRDVALLLEALAEHGALSPDEARAVFAAVQRGEPDARAFAPLTIATYRYLAQTPACLVFVQLDDAVVSFDQVNLPGTVLEYPNWRRKMAFEVEALAAHPTLGAIAAELRAERTQAHTN